MTIRLTKDIKYIENKCKKVRKLIIDSLYKAKSGHTGGSLSSVEIVTTIFTAFLRFDPDDPFKRERDKFILSKGHAAPVLYVNLALNGFFNIFELNTLRFNNTRLQGHPSREKLPCIDASTGSLGQGFSIAVGYALADKIDKLDYYTYVVLGDGEIQEGQIWEAAMSASHYKLDNIIAFLDHNKLQIDGEIKNVMNVLPIKEKFEAFGWDVIEIDGHNISEMIKAIERAFNIKEKPHLIVAHTIKGKGVDFIENKVKWHGIAPNKEEYYNAIKQLGDI